MEFIVTRHESSVPDLDMLRIQSALKTWWIVVTGLQKILFIILHFLRKRVIIRRTTITPADVCLSELFLDLSKKKKNVLTSWGLTILEREKTHTSPLL